MLIHHLKQAIFYRPFHNSSFIVCHKQYVTYNYQHLCNHHSATCNATRSFIGLIILASAMAWDPGGTSGQREHATTSMGGGLCGQAQPGLPRQLASGSFPAGAVRPAGRRGYFPRRPANCFPTGWRRCVTKVVLAEQVAAHDAAFVQSGAVLQGASTRSLSDSAPMYRSDASSKVHGRHLQVTVLTRFGSGVF